MAGPTIIKPLFPNVPDVAGVPAIRRQAGGAAAARVLLGILQNIIIARLRPGPKWGLYNSKGAVVTCDSIMTLDYRAESRVSDFPVIDGAFASYNKVQMPFMPTLRMTKGGSIAQRQAFLDAIEAAKQSLELFSIVTPEKTYVNVNVESYDYSRRASDTATLLIVEVRLREIRQVKPAFTTVQPLAAAKSPVAVSQTNTGMVQPKPANESLLSKILGKVSNK